MFPSIPKSHITNGSLHDKTFDNIKKYFPSATIHTKIWFGKRFIYHLCQWYQTLILPYWDDGDDDNDNNNNVSISKDSSLKIKHTDLPLLQSEHLLGKNILKLQQKPTSFDAVCYISRLQICASSLINMTCKKREKLGEELAYHIHILVSAE